MATITFGSNNSNVAGTPDNDSMTGNQPGGNFNDIVYGHRGDDAITFTSAGSSNNTLYGGQGNDLIEGLVGGGRNIIYGNLGDDSLQSIGDTGDTFYGGHGNDNITTITMSTGAVYGGEGDDGIFGVNDSGVVYYGGAGNDEINIGAGPLRNRVGASIGDVIYGDSGNDLLVGHFHIINSIELGGHGNDTLLFSGTDSSQPADDVANDTMTGGLGSDLFAATNTNGVLNGAPFGIGPSDIVTVTDFLSGTDKLSESHLAGVGLTKINEGAGGNAQIALNEANKFYSGHTGSQYVFVYGGTGAGYLFYNSDTGGAFATAGMALVGNNQEGSVAATDITTIPNNIPF
jgi:Ca2+-binding RTX toxin-like protein